MPVYIVEFSGSGQCELTTEKWTHCTFHTSEIGSIVELKGSVTKNGVMDLLIGKGDIGTDTDDKLVECWNMVGNNLTVGKI